MYLNIFFRYFSRHQNLTRQIREISRSFNSSAYKNFSIRKQVVIWVSLGYDNTCQISFRVFSINQASSICSNKYTVLSQKTDFATK